jgi:general secretion pathway protein E
LKDADRNIKETFGTFTVSTDLVNTQEGRRAALSADNRSAESVKHDTTELRKLAESLGLEFRASLGEVDPPRDLHVGDFTRIIGSWGKSFHLIPIAADEQRLTIAVSDPLQTEAIDALRICYDRPVRIIVCPEEEIMRAINGVRSTLMTDRASSLDAGDRDKADEISSTLKIDVTDAEDDDAPIIRYVNTLIFRAASERASDIHIEPFEDVLKVRFRIDGVLKDVDEEAKYFQPAILSRVKVMADLNIAEKRLPQDGRIGIKIAGEDVDIRVSTVPTRYGERIVLRLLDKSKVMLDLGSLGLADDITNVVSKIIRKSHGIILVTGPTGSGKTTTLYAWLSQINSQDKNILTVEDPIEYELHGIGQMQVNPKIDFTFATGLRSILRQDPDVIMVGEIRDLETAEIAVQASLTGHLVFSTLHTNDAPGAITRLLDMGVEPFLISSSLIAAMAQRLVRRLCNHCKVPHQLLPEECRELGVSAAQAAQGTVFTARDGGCKICQFTGYRGRCGIHEMLLIDDDVRAKIMQRSDASQIRAASAGLKSLRFDGAQKVLRGITSVEEVLRVTQEDALE